MTTPQDGVLRVTATDNAEIDAAFAKLHVRVEGEHFLTGNAVLSRAKEVKQLIEELKRLGIAQSDVQVTGVEAHVKQGLIAKGTKAVFILCICVRQLEQIGDVVGVFSAVKQAELTRLEWVYDEEVIAAQLAANAMKKALAKANLMLAGIQYQVTGIRAASDSFNMPHMQDVMVAAVDSAMPRSRLMSAAESMPLGTEFRSRQSVSATVHVEFLIAPKQSAG
jgi:uncharacterized protein YggE